MDIVFTVLILLLAVAASGIVTRMMRVALPLPLVQIAIGALLAWPKLGLHVTFDPEIFMMLFIPPLLFADGWRIPKRELFMARRSILMLALGLVFMTVLAVGYFIHALVPSISLPVAFALAAVLSPTDAVALSGIAGKGKIPGRLMHILEGEALMNDASGLVALKFAIAAALTGVFSLRDASISFVIIAVGGLATGAAVSWLFSFVSAHFLSLNEEGDPAPGVVMTLLIPFAAYLIAERFEFSGILAAVSAGMMMNYANIANAGPVSSRVRGNSTWTMIEFVFNGMVFILLGLQFPHILGRALLDAHETSDVEVWRLIGYIAAVAAALYAMRFVWVWLLRWFASRGAAKHGMASAVPGLRTVTVTTVAGVRGAVTLAGVLSLPEMLPNGTPLPGRDLAIFIASGVILLSLLVAVVALPLLLSGWRRGKDPHAAEEAMARTMAAQAAIRAVDEVHDRDCADLDESASAYAADVTARVMDIYRRRLATLEDEQEPREMARRADALEFRMKLAAMRAERKVLLALRNSQAINDETLNKLMREVDLSETALTVRKR
ncbi:UNVERIFIED_ORG: CPA1 family monovalent cation:H+ antiporter [Paraburkholderia sediminicola]|jgi:monovalent cation/hydrogen antiporter|uniref:Na+/H+ antiporter n=1 Tax=Paraburkholderia TaxID=1822464 RepID=UPI001909AE44|nr:MULTISPECIES: Na+/H+ antiporter [Paraburkholderia]MCP2085880.1 CPA1 family monovalent cation:H+ antiporter [Paraburkholderia sediminicola]MBK3839136.1 Na+/H+ antiporter [Paraburkholderia aspalathi]MCX4143007.1 Na+/H+ antiporter [Paraburkholderia aspalathi]MDN7175681.1 Na+/H+ antiporter [Paraburkholderia sp. SEWSISQ10-3 4]MDQ6505322.1 Na+/H+ antiporter [Paraburkholderia aspalathi]